MTSFLRQLRPGPCAALRVVVLEKRQGSNGAEDLWVADETASIMLLDVPAAIEEGDILFLKKGEVVQDEQRLFLRIGHGQLQKDGFLTLYFKEMPNLSENWEPQITEAAPVAVPAGHRCFLCGAEDHAVLECQYLSQGVVIRSVQLEELDRAQRRSVLEKALEALGIAAPVAVRWYKKANGRMDAPIQREKIGHTSIGLLFTLPPIIMEVKHGVFPLVFYTP
eukprot:symbB.v1.2.011832.t1/scaffold803.1/size162902/4